MTPDDLKKRTKQFGLRVIRLVEALPRTQTASVIGKQLLRCATSVGANYRAACKGRSKADFIAKLGIVEEELELLVEAKATKPNLVAELLTEANELTAIIVASRKTAKKHVKSTFEN